MKKVLYLFLLMISFIGCTGNFDNDTLLLVSKNGKYGYVNQNGKVIIPLEYDFLSRFNSGLALAEKNNEEFYIDKKNNILKLQNDYDDLRLFYDGMALVKKNDKYGYVDATGKEVIPCEYDFSLVTHFNEGVTVLKKIINIFI